MRAARLEALQDGFVRVHLQVQPPGEGGRVVIRVEDSGKGLVVARVMERPVDNARWSGRGIVLVRQLGRNASWSDQGRSASVEFFWEIEA